MSDNANQEVTPTNFQRFGKWLIEEFKKPAGHTGFWCYLVVVGILVGGIGVWISIYRDRTWLSVVGSLLTYFPAIAAASCFELVHADKHPEPKFARNVAIFSAATLGLAAVLISTNPPGFLTCLFGSLASLFALALWWLANANNPTLRDDPIASVGGDASAAPAGQKGDFNV